MRKKYTQEDDALIRSMAAEGESTSEIARALGRHHESVGGRMDLLGIERNKYRPPAKWTPEMDAIIKKYITIEYREDIARRLGVSKGAVIGRAKRLGLSGQHPAAPMAWTRDEDDFLRENVGKMTQADLGRELGRDPSSVSRRLERLGIKPEPKAPIVYLVPKKVAPVETIPLTARPWSERANGECRYLYGERGAYMACCAPVWGKASYCEAHVALCGGYKRVAA